MDRSFLSHANVIEASREFVCIRPATYEDAKESIYIKTLLKNRIGEIDNSVFTILAPDSTTKLVQAKRSMRSIYSDATAMATSMKAISQKYASTKPQSQLPLVSNVRLALNVAAADNLPLVVLYTSKETQVKLNQDLAKLAWKPNYLGRFIYTQTTDFTDLKTIAQAKEEPGLLVIQPDKFGVKGMTLVQVDVTGDWAKTLTNGAEKFTSDTKIFREHLLAGKKQGIFWETVTPVTDQAELRARQRKR